MTQGRVLILDGMWNKSLTAVRSFGKRGFHVTAGEKTRFATALFSRYCSKTFIYPSPTEKQEEFLYCLENELTQEDYDMVFPMELSTQTILSSNKERLLKYTSIPFADSEKTMRIQDKAFLMAYAEDNGFEIPKTYFIESIEHLEKIKADMDLPLVIKPRLSSGSRGIIYVKDGSELIASYLKVHSRFPLPIIQEYIPGGDTFGVGLLLNFESKVRASFVYKRLRTYPVNGGPSTLRESVKRDDIKEIAESLMRSLKWTGIAHVEFKIDPRDGKPKLLEVNPRFWGSLALATEAGMDFPYLFYLMTMNGDIEPVTEYKTGIRRRWLIPGDILHFLENPDRFRLNPSFFDFRVKDDIISLQDPLPAIGRLSSVFTLLYDKEMRKLIQ